MRRVPRPIVLLLSLLIVASSIMAQESQCDLLVSRALERLEIDCAGIALNQICYVQGPIEADTLANVAFNRVGRTLPAIDINRLSSSPMIPEQEAWGVTRLNLQLNRPDTAPDGVTVFIMGDVDLTPEDRSISHTREIIMPPRIFVRATPYRNATSVSGLQGGERVDVIGRDEDGEWVRLRWQNELRPEQQDYGWVLASLLEMPDIDPFSFDELDDLQQELSPPDRPFQVFRFVSGDSTPVCDTQSPDGILIQTPDNTADSLMEINEVRLAMAGTLHLTASASGEMTVRVLEGQATVTASDSSVRVPAGGEVSITLNAGRGAISAPSLLRAYDPADLAALPLLLLPTQIVAAPPLSDDQIQAQRLLQVPITGDWSLHYDKSQVYCPWGTTFIRFKNTIRSLTVTDDNTTVNVLGATLTRTGTGYYEGTYTHVVTSNSAIIGDASETYTLRVRERGLIQGTLSGIWSFPGSGTCPVTNTFELRYPAEQIADSDEGISGP